MISNLRTILPAPFEAQLHGIIKTLALALALPENIIGTHLDLLFWKKVI